MAGAPATRAIRVFVSSTFRDMQGERDELVKRVFPELRRRCEQRGVAWSEIDLRWGVTDEEKAEGDVLPICLREIELSRPYFIGMLGQRYGWVPDAIPADLAAREGWLAQDPGRSVTELEVLHGVLNDPTMEGHAFFYLRDPSWADALPTAERATYVDEDAGAQARLDDLKARARASGFPTHDYGEPRAIGDLVAADLGALIDALFPPDEIVDPVARDDEAHRTFAANRTAGYVDRPSLTSALDAAVATRPAVVTGAEGAGKSSLLASWSTAREATIAHFVGATSESGRWPGVLRRLIGALDRHRGATDDDLDQVSDDTLPKRFATTLAAAGAHAAVTVVIDGVDQLERDDHTPLFWLPETLAPDVHLVVSAAPGEVLDELHRRGWAELPVPDLVDEERRELITTFLARWAKGLDADHVDRLAGAAQDANPLFLTTILDELRQWGDHFTLGDQIEEHLAAADLASLFAVVLARYEADFDRDRAGLTRDALRLLWAGHRGVLDAELLDALGTAGEPLPRAQWSPLFLAAERNLLAIDGRLSFTNASFVTAVSARYLPTEDDQRAAHGALATLLGAGPLSARVVEELPYQLAGAGRWDDLAAWLARPDAFDASYRRSLPELQRLWTQVESSSTHTALDAYEALTQDPALGFQVAVLLAGRGHLHEAVAATEVAIHGHRTDGDDEHLLKCLLNRGAWQLQTGDLDGAEAAFTEATGLARARADRLLEQTAIGGAAVVRRSRRDFDGALALLREQEQIATERDDVEGREISVANQGSVLLDQTDLAGATERYAIAEQLARQLGNPSILGQVLSAQATVLAAQGHVAEAAARHAEHATTARAAGDRYGLSVALGNQAVTLMSLGQLDAALPLIDESTNLARAIGDRTGLARDLLVGASIAHQQGNPDRALALLAEHATVCDASGDIESKANGLGEQATILRERGDLEGALALHKQEQALHEQSGSQSGVATSIGNQALVALAKGDVAGALALMTEQEQRCRTCGWIEGLVTALGNHASVLVQTGNVAAAITVMQERATVLRGTSMTGDLVKTLSDLGGFLLDSGQAAAALPVLQEAEPLARTDAASPADRQKIIGRLGLVLVQTGQPDKGETLLREQEQLCRASGDVAGLSAALQNLALVASGRGDFAGALALTEEQLPLAQQAGDGMALLMGTANKGELLCRLGRTGEGLAALAQAEQWATQNGLAPLATQIAALAAQLRPG